MFESKRRALIFLILSLVLALIAGVMFLQKIKTLNAELGGMTKIYVAADDIPSRTLIKPEQVKTIEVPNKYVNNSYVTEVEDLIDKVLVVPLSKEDIITKTMIKPVSNARKENNRLVALPQSERVHFDQQLEALDRVDLIISQNFTGKPVTTTFMKDIPVAAVMKNDKKFAGVAIEVSAQDAPLIIHMQNYADSIRVLKANVGKGEVTVNEVKEKVPDSKPTESKSEDSKAGSTSGKPEQQKGSSAAEGSTQTKPGEAQTSEGGQSKQSGSPENKDSVPAAKPKEGQASQNKQ